MTDRSRRGLAAVLVVAGLALAAARPASLEAEIEARVNAIRREHGRPPLRSNATIAALAREHSRQMSRQRFFAHEAPDGGTVADRLRAAGLGFRMIGENLAQSRNAPDPVEAAVDGWMASEGHRANILRHEFTETGVGVWREADTYYVTQVFRRP